jgi:phage terminase large subunit-like protein
MTTEDRAHVAQRAAAALDALLTPRWQPLPHQNPPPGNWYGWLLLAGRGAGKTDACAEYIARHIAGPPCLPGPVPHWVGIIAPTQGDAVTACVTGPSGIKAHDPTAVGPITTVGGTVVRWPNGSQAKLYGANNPEDVERLRAGGNTCVAWLEEFAAWRHMQDAFDQLRFGLRSGPRPHWVASTTPKPKPLLKRLMQGEIPNVVTTTATMYDNPHLPQHIRDMLEDAYAGTDLGEQELYGRILDEIKNALWRRNTIAAGRIRLEDLPDIIRTTVGIDPSGGAGEQGIVVTAKSGLLLPGILPGPREDLDEAIPVRQPRPQHHGFVLDDRTCQLPPEGWGQRAVQAAIEWEADDLCVEVNYGGDQAIAVIRTALEKAGVDIPVRKVRATHGKAVRAQPVAALAAQGRMHHAGVFPELEDQLCTWFPELGWSPDRLDACLAAGTMVTTRRGLVPIEQVTTTDQAWTRAGWRRVTGSGMTRPDSEVMRVVTTHGEFTATSDHKVWTEQNGFIRVDAMAWGDRINVCPSRLNRLFSTASRSLASLCRSLARQGSTSRPTPTAAEYPEWDSSTSRSGRPRTALKKFLEGASSTTWTSTRSTTTPETSAASPARNTRRFTSSRWTATALSGWSTWRASAPWRPSGTAPTKAGSGTDSTPRTSTPSRSTGPRRATSAGSRTRLALSEKLSTALLRAAGELLTAPADIRSTQTVRSAGGGSGRASTSLFRRRVHPHVVRTYVLETRQPVYDLTIESEHEFYANGILVHNCVWGPWHMKLVGTTSTGQGSLGGDLARKQIVGGRLR